MASDPREAGIRERLSGYKGKKTKKGKWRFMVVDGDAEVLDDPSSIREILKLVQSEPKIVKTHTAVSPS